MVEAEERKIRERKEAVHEQEQRHEKAGTVKHKEHEKNHTVKKDNNKDGKEGGGDTKKE